MVTYKQNENSLGEHLLETAVVLTMGQHFSGAPLDCLLVVVALQSGCAVTVVVTITMAKGKVVVVGVGGLAPAMPLDDTADLLGRGVGRGVGRGHGWEGSGA